MYFMVWGKLKTPQEWRAPNMPPAPPPQDAFIPCGVFRCETAELACQAAAKKVGQIGTYFAIEGTPWGIDMMAVDDVLELGHEPPEEDEKERRIRALERGVLDKDVPV